MSALRRWSRVAMLCATTRRRVGGEEGGCGGGRGCLWLEDLRWMETREEEHRQGGPLDGVVETMLNKSSNNNQRLLTDRYPHPYREYHVQ